MRPPQLMPPESVVIKAHLSIARFVCAMVLMIAMPGPNWGGLVPARAMQIEPEPGQLQMASHPSDSTNFPHSSDPWTTVVSDFALRIADQNSSDADSALNELVRPKAGARVFDQAKLGLLLNEARDWRKYRLISVRAYKAPAVSVASDLASDLTRAGDVPAEIVSQLVPDNPDDLRRRNDAVALKFIDALLSPRTNDPIGVIAMLDCTGEKPRLVLILIRGVEVNSDGKTSLRVAGALFGDLEQALRAI